jgi:transposase
MRGRKRVNPLPPLDEEALAALKETIKRFGVLVPVLRNAETGALIDGHNRVAIAKELGLTYREQHITVPDDASDDEIARVVNGARRQLTPDQRRMMIPHLLELDMSERAIAAAQGVSRAQVRRDIKTITEGPGGPPGNLRHHPKERYSDELRARTVERIRDGERQSDVAKDLHIPDSTVNLWWTTAQRREIPKLPPNVRTLKVDPGKALPEMGYMLDGMVSSLPYIDTDAAKIDSLREVIESLNQSLNTLHRFLREISRVASSKQSASQDTSAGAPEMGPHRRDENVSPHTA